MSGVTAGEVGGSSWSTWLYADFCYVLPLGKSLYMEDGGGKASWTPLRFYEGLSRGCGTEDLWWGHKGAEIPVDSERLGDVLPLCCFLLDQGDLQKWWPG